MRSEIPFRLIGGDQPLIVVSARFNDSQPVDCAIDTGASHAMLLPEVGVRLGVHVDETREAMGAGGAVTVRIGKAKTVAHTNLLRRFRVTIDYPGKTLRLA